MINTLTNPSNSDYIQAGYTKVLEQPRLPNLISWNDYQPTNLEELSVIKPGNRKDTKFIFSTDLLPIIAAKLRAGYKILEISSKRSFSYNNRYCDTGDFKFYLQHHNGSRPRNKIRFRCYQNSGISYFEIKTKNNKGRTIKDRLQLGLDESYLSLFNELSDSKSTAAIRDLIRTVTGVDPSTLINVLGIKFTRITLVNDLFTERVTIDNNLTTYANGTEKTIDGLTIAEIKQDKYKPSSYFIQLMRSLSIPETRFSKYCLGINNHYYVKNNRFKPRFSRLEQILNNN